jgi:hypothetical protein
MPPYNHKEKSMPIPKNGIFCVLSNKKCSLFARNDRKLSALINRWNSATVFYDSTKSGRTSRPALTKMIAVIGSMTAVELALADLLLIGANDNLTSCDSPPDSTAPWPNAISAMGWRKLESDRDS